MHFSQAYLTKLKSNDTSTDATAQLGIVVSQILVNSILIESNEGSPVTLWRVIHYLYRVLLSG